MTEQPRNNQQRLTQLRAKIDAVDESIHNLLMQRASVIDELITVKGAATQTGAAFKPAREASMMRILVDRHSGSIPLDMIIHIWRDIISTFTHLQANYSVHLSDQGDANTLRDMARFQFGFSVPIESHGSAKDALYAVKESGNALSVVPLEDAGCWWQHLDGAGGLGIMARLPVTETLLPTCDAFVIAPPVTDAVPYDYRCYAGFVSTPNALDSWSGGEVIAVGEDQDRRLQALIAIPEGGTAPNGLVDIRAVGGYFAQVKTTS